MQGSFFGAIGIPTNDTKCVWFKIIFSSEKNLSIINSVESLNPVYVLTLPSLSMMMML